MLALQNEAPKQNQRITCEILHGEVVKMVKPVYPPMQAAHGIGGKVVLRVNVGRSGEPTSIHMTEGNPFLVSAAIDAVKQWRWRPLKLNGKSVPMQTTVTVNFRPNQKSTPK